MFDRGHVFRLFARLPTHFASQSDAPVGAPRRFGSTEHLSTEAVAAYVDGELRMNAYMRAAIDYSPGEAQRQAREALRDSYPVDPPTSLVCRLTQIPFSSSLEPEAHGPDADVVDEETRDRRRRR